MDEEELQDWDLSYAHSEEMAPVNTTSWRFRGLFSWGPGDGQRGHSEQGRFRASMLRAANFDLVMSTVVHCCLEHHRFNSCCQVSIADLALGHLPISLGTDPTSPKVGTVFLNCFLFTL